LSFKILFLVKNLPWWIVVKGPFDLLANETKYIFVIISLFHLSPACLAGGLVLGEAMR
jgi:hypothetical protein